MPTTWLIPRFTLREAVRMASIASVGAMVGGCYGAVHDLATYSLGPEYFSRLKFDQFQWAGIGLPDRWFAMQIGFMAAASVGFFAGWFLARKTVPEQPAAVAYRACLRGFAWVFAMAALGASIGYLMGASDTHDWAAWDWVADDLGVHDVRAFGRVAYMHNGSYLGAFVGLIAALLRTSTAGK
jgi:hypothetical protein